MAYYGRHRETGERHGIINWMAKRKIRCAIGAFAMFDIVRSGIEEARFIGHPTVIESFAGNTKEMGRDLPNAWCVIFPGLGINNADEIAQAYFPVMNSRCQIATVTYSDNGFSPNESARQLSDFFDERITKDKPVNLVSVGMSAGGIRQFLTLRALLHMRSDIHLKTVVNHSSPTGSIDTKGPLEGLTVEAGGLAAKTPLRHSLMATPLQYAGEYASRTLRASDADKQDPRRFSYDDVSYVVNNTDWKRYLEMLETIREFAQQDHNAAFMQGTPFYYFRAARAEHDNTVNVDAADYNWRQLVGHGTTIYIQGGGHANPAQTPGDILAMSQVIEDSGLPTRQEVISDDRERRHFLSQLALTALQAA